MQSTAKILRLKLFQSTHTNHISSVKGEITMMNVLAKPINQVIIIAPDKAEKFINQKTDPAIKARIMRNAERFRKQSKDRKDD